MKSIGRIFAENAEHIRMAYIGGYIVGASIIFGSSYMAYDNGYDRAMPMSATEEKVAANLDDVLMTPQIVTPEMEENERQASAAATESLGNFLGSKVGMLINGFGLLVLAGSGLLHRKSNKEERRQHMGYYE